MRQLGHVALASLLAVTLALTLHQVYLTRAGADAVYMDTLRLLWQASDFQHGRFSLIELWGQNGSPHSGLLFQMLLAANVSWFGLDTMLANRLTGVVIGGVALLLCGGYLLDLRRTKRFPPAIVSMLVVAITTWLCFSFSGYEVLTLDLGLGLWLKNFLIFALFLMHAETLQDNRVVNFAAVSALSVYGVLVIVFCAMGWSYAVMGAVVGTQLLHHVVTRTHPTLSQMMLPASLALSQLVLTVGKRMYFGVAYESQTALGADSLRQWLLSLASTFVNAETAARLVIPMAVLVTLGSLLALGFVIATVIRLRDHRASLMPVHLIAYASLCAVSFVLARGGLGDDAVMASRYHMDLFPGLVGLLWIASMPATDATHLMKQGAAGAIIGLACLTAWYQGRETSEEWSIAPYRKIAFEGMKQALLAGVPNEAAATLLQSPLEDARRAAAVMRRDRLAVFRGAQSQPAAATMCAPDWRLGEGWYARETSGTWSSAKATFEVPACACEYKVDLFIPAIYTTRIVTVSAAATRAPIATLELQPGHVTPLAIPASAAAQRYLLASSRTTIPAHEGIGQDIRALGVYMGQPQTSCAGP